MIKDRVVIVTGATKGMGLASAKSLLELGANVVMVYRADTDVGKNVVNDINTYSNQILLIQADITNA